MPKTREPAPEVFAAQQYKSDRARLVAEYSAKDPAHRYFWKRLDSSQRAMAKIAAEPVKVDGEPINNGKQMLCRAPIEHWTERRKRQEESSLREMKSVVAENADKTSQRIVLTQVRNPRRAIS